MISRNLTNKRALFIAFSACAIFMFSSSRFSEFLELTYTARVHFRVKQFSNALPKLDPRIKIFAIDDLSLSELSHVSGSYKDWSNLLFALSNNRPKAIFIDKVFSQSAETDADAERFQKSVLGLGVPVFVGGFYASDKLVVQNPVNASFLRQMDPKQVLSSSKVFYGPEKRIVHAFEQVGHLSIESGFEVPAFLVDKRGLASITLGLVERSKNITISDGIQLAGENIPLYKKQFILPNLATREFYLSKTTSLVNILKKAKLGQGSLKVSPGDYVFILPEMYTGHVDFKVTPSGLLEGGFLHVAVVNSLLKNQWLTPVLMIDWQRSFLTLLFFVIFCALSTIKKPKQSVFIVIAALMLVPLTGIALHVFFDFVAPWLTVFVSLVFFGFFDVMFRLDSVRKHSLSIEHAMSGLVSADLLKLILKNPENFKFDSSEIDVSVMFIDIEEFSLKSQNLSPQKVFENLRAEFNMVSSLIHKHGGVIDKNLGDGLLCYFGYHFGCVPSKMESQHAKAALACAIEIQRSSVEKILSLNPSASPSEFLPFRIGINSGTVFIGNLGNSPRLDVTLIGSTVNLGKRLEDSAEVFRVMIGETTALLLEDSAAVGVFVDGSNGKSYALSKGCSLKRRLIPVKHHSELVNAFECDPFSDEPMRYQKALLSLRLGMGRKKLRVETKVKQEVFLFQDGQVVGSLANFSADGLAFDSLNYYSRKVQLFVQLDDRSGQLLAMLKNRGMTSISIQIRWGTPFGEIYRHGCEIIGYDAERKKEFSKLIHEFLADERQAV